MAEHNQQFTNFDEWCDKAPSWLTRHPLYTEGGNFHAVCFDTKGRLCRIGGDFMRARDENTFPVRWAWPNQIAALLRNIWNLNVEPVKSTEEKS